MFPLNESGVLLVCNNLRNNFLDLCSLLLLDLRCLGLQLPSILSLWEVSHLFTVKKALRQDSSLLVLFDLYLLLLLHFFQITVNFLLHLCQLLS